MSERAIVRVICDSCGNRDLATVTRDSTGALWWNRPASRVVHGDGFAIGDSDEAVMARLDGGPWDRGAVRQQFFVGRLEVWCREHGTDWVDPGQLQDALHRGTERKPGMIRVAVGHRG